MRHNFGTLAGVFLMLGLGFYQPASAEPGLYEQYRDAGERYFGQNNYGQAEKNFLLALKEAEKFGPKDIRLAASLKNLASLYEVRGQFAKAEGYWERELRSKEKALGGENPQVLSAVAKILRFYLSHNQPAKADKLSRLLLAYSERINKQNQVLDGHFTELSKYFTAHGEYSAVDIKLKQVDETMKKVRADDNLELAASFDAIAALYKEKSKLSLAEQFYRHAMELREKALPPGHMALSFSYDNLGKLYMEQGKTGQAQALFKQSLDVTGNTLDLKRPEVFGRLDSLARSYLASGQNNQAETLYKQALTLLRQNSGSRGDVGKASQALGELYLKQGRCAEAVPLLKTALSVSEGAHGPQSADLIPVLESYAESLDKTNQNGEAAKIRQRARSIRGTATAISGKGNPISDF